MKRLSKFITLLFVMLIITGCVRQKVSMEISKNGEISVSAIIAYADSTGRSVTEEERAQYKASGFKIEEYEADDYKGVKLSKKYKISEVSSDSTVSLSLKNLLVTEKPKMFQKVGDKKYKANFILDATVESGQTGSGADISYTVTLPSKPISHNADKVDGNTLTWTADLGDVKNINYEFSLSGSSNVLWIILGIIGVAIIAIIVVVVVMNNKNKNNGMENMNGMQPPMPNPVPPVQPVVNTPESLGVQSTSETTTSVEPQPAISDVFTQEVTSSENIVSSSEVSENSQVVTEAPTENNQTTEM